MHRNVKTLVDLGLTDKQAAVYLALQQLGEATVYKIAKFSNLKRPTVYVLLDELRQLDLVLKVPHAKAQVFRAKALAEFIEKRASAVQQGFDLAESLAASQVQVENPVLYFEGLSGVEQAIQYRLGDLEGGRSSAILGHLSDDQLMPLFEKWHEKASSYQNFSFRALVSGKQFKKHFSTLRQFSDEGGYVTTRVLPGAVLPYDFSFEVFDCNQSAQFLRIVADKDLQATIIETPVVCNAFLKLFDSLWDQSEEVAW